MIGAIVIENIVRNLIVIAEENIPEIAEALQCEIIDAAPYGLQVGDLRTAAGWTRNAGGEQMILQPVDPENYGTFEQQQRKIVQLEEAVATANESAGKAADEATAEALALMGLEG